MNEFMVTINLPEEPTPEFFSLVPSHWARVNELMQQGVVTGYSLSADRRILWMTMMATDQEEIVKTLMTLPLYHYMRYVVQELMFHNSPVFSTPRFSVN